MKHPDIQILKATFPEDVSFFSGVKDKQAKHINLGRYLLATIAPRGRKEREAAQIVEQIRQTGDKSQKKQLPGITPSALIAEGEGRKMTDFINDDNLQAVTNWFQFDIDLDENKHLQNNPNLTAETIRNRLASESPYVAYCGLSCSGYGVWGLIKLEDSANHSEHFLALIEDFQQANIQLDTSKGGNLNDFRFYSYDSEAHINPNYRIYRKRKKPEPAMPVTVNSTPGAGITQGQYRVSERYPFEGTRIEGAQVIANGNSEKIKHPCPSCGRNSYVRVVDRETGEYMPFEFGSCDHKNSCGYARPVTIDDHRQLLTLQPGERKNHQN
jgi:hypothetical protein